MRSNLHDNEEVKGRIAIFEWGTVLRSQFSWSEQVHNTALPQPDSQEDSAMSNVRTILYSVSQHKQIHTNSLSTLETASVTFMYCTYANYSSSLTPSTLSRERRTTLAAKNTFEPCSKPYMKTKICFLYWTDMYQIIPKTICLKVGSSDILVLLYPMTVAPRDAFFNPIE